MKSTFVSMFPLPPDVPLGKFGYMLSYLNPITEIPSLIHDYGIVDAAWFAFSPNESRKFNDAVMDVYNYVNMSDAIKIRGAKCYLYWNIELPNQIKITHSEFMMGGIPSRTNYISRVATPAQNFTTEGTPPLTGEIIVPEIPYTVQNAQINPSLAAPPSNVYEQPCTPVNGVTTAKYPPETRKWIHNLRYIHPLVDSQIKSLKLFQPVSEHMGENVITYNSDTPAIDVKEWYLPTKTISNIINPNCVKAYGSAHCLREIIRERMISAEPDGINGAWTNLNALMASNAPREVDFQTAMGTGLWAPGTRDSMASHGLIMVNDTHHWKDRIDPIKIPVAEMLFAYLQEATQLINHMYPLINSVVSEKRNYRYEPLLTKTVDNKWTIYERASPVTVFDLSDQAPLDIDYSLFLWGYRGTQVVEQNWTVNVGLAVEETFPRKKPGSGTFDADMYGNKIKGTTTNTVDDGLFVPEQIDLPLA